MKTIRTSDMGRHGPLPVKRRKVLEWTRAQIALGKYKPGAMLPPRKWFREKFGIADHPVQQVFAELEGEGLVRAVSGHGTYVAEKLPFVGRFLLLLNSRRKDAGVNIFAPALQSAACQIASARGVHFDIRALADAEEDSQEYAETLSEIRRQRFSGVVVQGVAKGSHGLQTFTNVDNVPIVYFDMKSELSQGNLAVSLPIYGREYDESLFERHFTGLVSRGCRRVAVFRPNFKSCCSQETLVAISKRLGIEIVKNGYHTFDMLEWNPSQFGRWIDLFLNSDAGRAADSVILGDDNMLSVFTERVTAHFGSRGATRYRVSCHCNFPCPPKATIPVDFHGPDLIGALSTFIDYAEACRAGERHPEHPRLGAI